jgi:integrase
MLSNAIYFLHGYCTAKLFFCIFALSPKKNKMKVRIRYAKDKIGILSLSIFSRNLHIHTDISLHLKMKVKDFCEETGLPKKIYDVRPVPELNGMSYSDLTKKIQKIIQTLTEAERNSTLTVDLAKKTVIRVLDGNGNRVEKYQTLVSYIENYINECKTGVRLRNKSTKKLSHNSITSYQNCLYNLRQFEEKNHVVLDFDDMTMTFFNSMRSFLVAKNLSPNSIAHIFVTLKVFLKAALRQKLTRNVDFQSPEFGTHTIPVDNVYLTAKRIDQLYSAVIDEDLAKQFVAKLSDSEEKRHWRKALSKPMLRRLNVSKDIFLIGCLTGQRAGDYMRMNINQVVKLKDGNNYIKIMQQKTGKTVFIPLDNRVLSILRKYEGHLPNIPYYSLIRHLKVVGRIMGWTENAGKLEHRGSLEFRSNKKFYECITSHTARRSFATNAYKAGVPLSAIMSVTGHSSEEMLRRYLKLDNKERAMLASAAFRKAMGS